MVLSQLLESTWNVQDFSVDMQEDRWVIGSRGWEGASSPGGNSHIKGAGMLVRNFKLNPKGDQSERGPTFFWPLKAISLNFDLIHKLSK